jgi:CubicO group peptidase (beta-lactamase class C family)
MKPEAIDADTVFQLASVSKPLTATVIAGVVSDRIVTWDSRTSDFDPTFQRCYSAVAGLQNQWRVSSAVTAPWLENTSQGDGRRT